MWLAQEVHWLPPHAFPNDAAKISHFVGLLWGKALEWASFDAFLGEFKKTFTHPSSEGNMARRLLELRQVWPETRLQGLFFGFPK